MQSDTVIGIVGAVVLVGVMVGVFAYEYNNVDVDDEPTAAEQRAMKMASFNETFPDLDPEGDLDMDGTPNYNETDLDGDGINNTEDDVFEYTATFDAGGSVTAPPTSSGYTLSFDAEAGVGHVMLTLSHPERLSADQNALVLNIQLQGPEETRSAQATTSGGTTTYVIDWMDAAPGTYTLMVDPFSVGGVVSIDPGTTVSGDVQFHYFA